MFRMLSLSIVSLLSAPGIALAADEITVEIEYSGGSTDTYYFDSGEAIAFTLPGTARLINVYADTPSVDDIGRITLTGGPTSGSPLRIRLGTGAWVGLPNDHTSVADDWAGLNITTAAVRANTHLEGGINGDLTDAVSVGEFFRLDIDGSVDSHLLGGGDAAEAFIRVGSVSSNGKIEITGGASSYTKRFIVLGRADGEIDVSTEDIFLISIGTLGGSVTTSEDCAEIKVVTMEAGSEMDLSTEGEDLTKIIKVTNDIGTTSGNATISTGGTIGQIIANSMYVTLTATKQVRTLETRTGDLAGSLTVDGLATEVGNPAPGLFIAGDLDADIVLTNQVDEPIEVDGSLVDGRSIVMGGALSEDLEFGTDGLEGQIIVNADPTEENNWNPANTVTVGSEVLDPTSGDPVLYTTSSASLGGGAVGVVPFYYHPVDCDPDHEEEEVALPTEIIVEFYGPIIDYAPTSGKLPVTIEVADKDDIPAGCGASDCGVNTDCDQTPSPWTSVSADWTYSMHPGGNTRRIKLSPYVPEAFASSQSLGTVPANAVYRVRPKADTQSNYLACDLDLDGTWDTGEPAVARPDRASGEAWVCDLNYKFFVDTRSAMNNLDFDGSGVIDIADALDWSRDPIDLNYDGRIDSLDLVALATARGGATGS